MDSLKVKEKLVRIFEERRLGSDWEERIVQTSTSQKSTCHVNVWIEKC